MIDIIFIFGAKYLYFAIGGIAIFYFLLQSSITRKDIIILSTISLPIMYAVSRVIGIFYYSTLPFVEDDFTPLITHESDNGFPSDHTLVGAAISSMLYPFSKKISMISWALTFVVGASRVYAGIHRPIDIVGSIVIAIVVTIVVYGLIQRWKSGIKAGSPSSPKASVGR